MEGVKKFVTWIMSNHPMLAARSSGSLLTATTLSFTVIGTACPPRGEAVVDIFRAPVRRDNQR
jgi:hypothetical protein